MATRSAAWLLVALAAFAAASSSASAQTTLGAWAQCGGSSSCGSNTPCADAEWTTVRCPSGYACVRQDSYYRQCKALNSLPSNFLERQAAMLAAQQAAQQRDERAAAASGKTLVGAWGQCGGRNGCGANTPCADANWDTVQCAGGFTCVRQDQFFRQCKPNSPQVELGTIMPVASPRPAPVLPVITLPSPVPASPAPVASPRPAPVLPVITLPSPVPASPAAPMASPRPAPVLPVITLPSPTPSPVMPRAPVPSPRANATVPPMSPVVVPVVLPSPTTNTTRTPSAVNGTANSTQANTTVFTMQFPGVSLEDFQRMYADATVQVVASTSGVPASAVRGSYAASSAAAGRRLLQATGVDATYTVTSTDPAAVEARWQQQLANNGANFYSALNQLGVPLRPSVSINGQPQITADQAQAAVTPAAAPAAPAPADDGSNTGKIVGGVVGGVVGALVLGLLAVLTWRFCRRRRERNTPAETVSLKDAEAPVETSPTKRTPGAPSTAPGAPTTTPAASSSTSSGVLKYGSGAAAAAAAGAAAAAAASKTRANDDGPDVAPRRDQNPAPYTTNPFAAGAADAAALPPNPRRSIGVRAMAEEPMLAPVPEVGNAEMGEVLSFGPRQAMLHNYNANQHPSLDYTPTQPIRDSVDIDRNSFDTFGGSAAGRAHPVVRAGDPRMSTDSFIEYVPTESHPTRQSQETMRTSAEFGAFPTGAATGTASSAQGTSVETPPQIGAGAMMASHPVASSEGGTLASTEPGAPLPQSHAVAFSDAGTVDSRPAAMAPAMMQSHPVAMSDAGTMRTSVDSRATGYAGAAAAPMQSYPVAMSDAGTMRTSVDSRAPSSAVAPGMQSYPVAFSDAGRTSMDSRAPSLAPAPGMQSYPVALSDAGTVRTSIDSRMGGNLSGAAAALAATQSHPIVPSDSNTTRTGTSMDMSPQVQAYQLPTQRASIDSYIEYVPTESHPIQLRPSMDSVADSYVAPRAPAQAGGAPMASHPVRFSTDSMMSGMTAMTGMTGGPSAAPAAPAMASHPVRFSTDSMMSGMTGVTGAGSTVAPASIASEEALAAWRRQGGRS